MEIVTLRHTPEQSAKMVPVLRGEISNTQSRPLNGHPPSNILSKLQHGFRSKHACVSQLTITINDLLKHRDKRTQIDMAILDFSKAFDTVPHQRLLGKLSFYGIKGPLLNWIAAFLKGRHQRVVVGGMTSGQVPLESGVPQGSVLGPLLFLLHIINDLPNGVTSQVRLFADDCLLYRPIRSMVDQEGFQRDLEALEQWATTWGMIFNANKCYLMNITRTRNHLTHNCSLNNHILQTVTREKYLGNTISLLASPMWPIGNPEMLSTSNFYGGNVIYMVWKDKLA